MTTKQQVESKKEQTTMARSVMLTRFKLSQQKEKKENETNGSKLEQISKSPGMLQKSKTSKTNKSSKKCKKDEKIQNEETAELHPNKLKRDKLVKKVVLKPKHKLIIIGRSSGSKRKINEVKDEVKTSTPKRKKTALKNSTLDPSIEPNERSQSPVYSELGFEEMIRMADENQALTDEDLMEILTCPSPVWWEEPLNETFIEGPIILKSIKQIPPPAVVPQRSKHSRKKTPHKVIIEPPIHKDDTKDFIQIIDTNASNNKRKSDHKFNNKRSKLENLLSTIKNKLNETKTSLVPEKLSEKEPKKVVERNETTKSKKDTSSGSLDEDILLPEISPLDSDSLKNLENMTIPIENKDDLQTESGINPKITEAGLNNEENESDVLKKKSKDNPIKKHFMKIKTRNVKKPSSDASNVKSKRNMPKVTPPTTNKAQQKQIDNKVYNSYTIKNKISPKTRHKLLNETDRTDSYITDSDDTTEGSISDQSNNKITFTKTKSDFEEYMTVFKIITTDEAQNIEKEDEKETNAAALKDMIGNEAVAIENESTDKGKLKRYYKICKNTPKAQKIIKDAPDTEHQTKYTEEKAGDNEICDDCNDNKSAIVVHDTGDVKYCLKCSSIFDMEECNYCVRKEIQKQREREANTSGTECDVEDTKRDSL